MSEKGSELNAKLQKEQLIRTLHEFTEKLENDPYQPGIVHPNLCPDDLQDIIEDVMWVRDFSEITIKIIREPSGAYISAEVTERKK